MQKRIMESTQNPNSLTMLCLGTGDDVFRAIMMVMSELEEYKNSPLSTAKTIHYCVKNEKYLAVLRGNELVGGVLWFDIDGPTRDKIIREKWEPLITTPIADGEAIFLAAAFAVQPVIAVNMMRAFFKHMHHRDVVYIRHWQNKQRTFKPMLRKAKCQSHSTASTITAHGPALL